MKKLVQPKKASPRRLEEKVSEAVADVSLFYVYAEVILHEEGLYEFVAKRLYNGMKKIADKYSQNNSLKNKLDEAERYIWPTGKR